MSNPIKSTSTSAASSTMGTQSSTTAASPTDWLARMTGERGAEGSGASSFARWMAQHSQQAQTLTQVAAQNLRPAASASPNNVANVAKSAHAPMAPSAAKDGPSWSTTQARLAAQRSQAAQGAARPASPSQAPAKSAQKEDAAQKPEGAHGRKAAKVADEAKDAKDAKDAKSGAKADGAQDADAAHSVSEGRGDKDEVRYTTAMGDGTAIVRELTPPPGVQANDPAGMMAWLAQLTQASGDVAQGAHGAGKGLDVAGEAASSTDGGLTGFEGDRRHAKGFGRDQGEDTGRSVAQALDALTAGADLGGKGAAAGVRADAAVQADTLLKTTSVDEAKDAAALMASDGARLAGFGQSLAEVKQALPHAQATLPTPLDAPDFSQKLADQISLWVGKVRNDGPMTAELHLNPAEMGPINVKISLDGQTAHVDFAAAAQETRHAIQASLSALSSSLNDVGLSLAGGGVFSQSSQQQAFAQGTGSGMGSGRGGNDQSRGSGSGGASDEDGLTMRQVSAPRGSRLGGLDLYA